MLLGWSLILEIFVFILRILILFELLVLGCIFSLLLLDLPPLSFLVLLHYQLVLSLLRLLLLLFDNLLQVQIDVFVLVIFARIPLSNHQGSFLVLVLSYEISACPVVK